MAAGAKKTLRGNMLMLKGKKFPQAGNVQSTLTEKIHNLRIAAYLRGQYALWYKAMMGPNQIASTRKGVSESFGGK